MQNSVELLGTYGGDTAHALSAWTSTSRDLEVVEKSGRPRKARIPALLKMLAENGHHTPFEKSAIHFLVTCDKATHIQLLKHRIGVSVNGESARYKELKDDKWYSPADWPQHILDAYEAHMASTHAFYHELISGLEANGVDRKRAKESARLVLPHASQIVQDVQFNFRSFMHFLELRLKPDAQLEVQAVALEMLGQVWDTGAFDESLRAFGWTVERFEQEESRLDQLARRFSAQT